MSTVWPRVRLGDVLRFTPRLVAVEPARTYREIGIRSHGRGIFHKSSVTGLEIGAKRVFYIEPGDFVLNIVFAWEGAVAVTSDSEAGTIASHRFPTFRPDPMRLELKYLLYWCQTEPGRSLLDRVSPGGAGRNRTLNRDAFLNQDVPLPPLMEQRRRLAQIEELTGEIRAARSLREEASDQIDAFVTSFHTQLAAGRRRQLGDILELHEDATEVLPMGIYPQVGIRSFGGGLFPKAAVTGTETTYKRFNTLYAGAVVLSQVKGWEGAVAVCPAELSGWFASPEYRTFRCMPSEALPGYIARLVRTEWFWSRLRDATRGVGARRERTRPEHFVNIELPMPDVEQQKRGESLFAEVDATQRMQAETAAALHALFPTVLDRAFEEE